MARLYEVEEHIEQEFSYTVKIRRPFRLECDGGDPTRCFHDGSDEDAMAVLEADLCARLTHEDWRIEVVEREPYAPTAQEAILRLENALRLAGPTAPPTAFAKLVFAAKHVKTNLKNYSETDAREARNMLAKTRRKIGL